MTVLSTVQDAATRMGISVPSVLFSATDRTSVEVMEAVNEAAASVRDDFDWQRLRVQYTITGDGSYTSFDLPSDFARMLKVSRLWPSDEPNTPLLWVTDSDKWLAYEVQDIESITRRATIYGNQIHISPTLESAVTVKFFYISNKTVLSTGQTTPNQNAFSADTDSFFLDERVLKLSLIWRWKAAKGRPYEGDKQEYERALDVAAGADRGSRVLHIGKNRMPSDAVLSYPRAVGV